MKKKLLTLDFNGNIVILSRLAQLRGERPFSPHFRRFQGAGYFMFERGEAG